MNYKIEMIGKKYHIHILDDENISIASFSVLQI